VEPSCRPRAAGRTGPTTNRAVRACFTPSIAATPLASWGWKRVDRVASRLGMGAPHRSARAHTRARTVVSVSQRRTPGVPQERDAAAGLAFSSQNLSPFQGEPDLQSAAQANIPVSGLCNTSDRRLRCPSHACRAALAALALVRNLDQCAPYGGPLGRAGSPERKRTVCGRTFFLVAH